MTFLYFAYGSNMLSKKLQLVAPSAKTLGTGRISGYRLRFNKQSDDGSGKCNIVITETETDEVYGVIYAIDEVDSVPLRKSEGGYEEKTVAVVAGNEKLTTLTYVARTNKTDDLLRPYDWYKDYCVHGALEHKLPEEYIREHIQVVPADTDQDQPRRDKHCAFLSPAP